MYIFEANIQRSGGAFSEATLMRPSEGKLTDCKLRQYFERAGHEDVEFFSLEAFCPYLAECYYKDKRTVFFKENLGSQHFDAYSTSPYVEHTNEIFRIGTFKSVG